MGETFLGMSSTFWQFVSAFLSTAIVGICMGIVSAKWLNKRELLNAQEGELLNQRVDAYMMLLDFMASMENKKVVMDPDFSLREQLDKEGIVIRRDRPAVEYWPMMESFEKFQKVFEGLDRFYKSNLSLMDPKAARELVFVYGMFSKVYGYFMYLSSLEWQPGTYLSKEEVEDILSRFYPKLGMVLDVDFTVMQAKLEQKVVAGLYKPSFSKNKKFFEEKRCVAYFEKRYLHTDLCMQEQEIFQALIEEVCRLKHLNRKKSQEQFLPNHYVQSYEW